MIEVSIRRPCSERHPLVAVPGTPWKTCRECGGTDGHQPVHEWLPLAEAMRLAHVEEAVAVGLKSAGVKA